MLTYIYIIAFAYTFANLSGVPQFILFMLFSKREMKPFTCAMCVSFWLTLAVAICEYFNCYGLTNLINFTGPAFACFVVAGMFENIVRRYVI